MNEDNVLPLETNDNMSAVFNDCADVKDIIEEVPARIDYGFYTCEDSLRDHLVLVEYWLNAAYNECLRAADVGTVDEACFETVVSERNSVFDDNDPTRSHGVRQTGVHDGKVTVVDSLVLPLMYLL